MPSPLKLCSTLMVINDCIQNVKQRVVEQPLRDGPVYNYSFNAVVEDLSIQVGYFPCRSNISQHYKPCLSSSASSLLNSSLFSVSKCVGIFLLNILEYIILLKAIYDHDSTITNALISYNH